MVIFVFLRSVWATIIPSVTVPLALLGACALMWVVGLQPRQSVADGADHLGRLRRRRRDRDAGEHHPLHRGGRSAAGGGDARARGEIGFTIVSISISLIAVLIPLLLMGGIIGRLFREFAVTLSMTIVVSAVVSLTLTPMMASRFLKPAQGAQARPALPMERARLRRAAEGLRARPRLRARPPLHHAAGLPGDAGAVGLPVRHHPQGLLPAAGHRPDHRHLRRRAGHLVRRHDAIARRRSARSCARIPAVAHVAMSVGGTGNPLNTGRMFITLKPRDQRDVTRRPDHRAAAAASSTRSRAPSCSCRRRRTCASAAAPRARSTSTRCRIPTSTS